MRGLARRHTGSKVCYVIKGSGATILNGRRLDWTEGDFFAVLPWSWHEHLNPGVEDALLFEVHDLPALRALGYAREEALATSDGHQAEELAP